MSRQYINAQVKRLQHPPNWIRINDGGEAYLKSLWESYAERPLYPLICVPSGDWLEVWTAISGSTPRGDSLPGRGHRTAGLHRDRRAGKSLRSRLKSSLTARPTPGT